MSSGGNLDEQVAVLVVESPEEEKGRAVATSSASSPWSIDETALCPPPPDDQRGKGRANGQREEELALPLATLRSRSANEL